MLPWLPYILFGYLCNKLAQGLGLAPGQNLSERLLAIGDGIQAAFSQPLPSLNPTDLLIGIAGALFLRLAVYTRSQNVKKYRHTRCSRSGRSNRAVLADFEISLPDSVTPGSYPVKITLDISDTAQAIELPFSLNVVIPEPATPYSHSPSVKSVAGNG